jgi:hypothetical protein
VSHQVVRRGERFPAGLQLAGSGGENPEVSAVSRFHDDVWDFLNEDRNPARGPSEKKICWSFPTPKGDLFTDPPFRSLLMASKQFLYALRWRLVDSAPFAVGALPSMFQRTKRFVDHLVGYLFAFLTWSFSRVAGGHHWDQWVVAVAALLFAAVHLSQPGVSWLQAACITSTGTLYGWIRTFSGSAAPAAVSHAAYNLTLYAVASFVELFAKARGG